MVAFGGVERGTLSYGLPDRLCLKIVHQPHRRTTPVSIRTTIKNRNKDDNIKALWTPRQSQNMQISTESPRMPHASKFPMPNSSFVAALHEREQRFGYQASLKKSAARCAHTAYGNRVNDASRVIEALKWPVETQPKQRKPANTPSPYLTALTSRSINASTRPITAPATAPGGSSPTTTWDIVQQQSPFRATSSRFAAHTAAEEKRIATLDPVPGRVKARLEFHATRRASRELKIKALQALAENWPHGLPTARRLSAEKKGLGGYLGGLGYGNSAQSMPEAQYNALKGTLKLP
ncbi:hypothetical protein Ndes2437B_g06581 [Nannochloris sp. 'desiccata']